MQRSQDLPGSAGLGPGLAGEKISVNNRNVSVIRQIGEGGFSFAYLVKDLSSEHSQSDSINSPKNNISIQSPPLGSFSNKDPRCLVLKITSIHNRQQRDIAEKEAKLLGQLSHPSIVRLVDSCYRTVSISGSNSSHVLSGFVGGSGIAGSNNVSVNNSTTRAQHLILMEYCEGGTAYQVCNNMKSNNKRFNLPSLIIAFGQICNAVSYLHAQRPPIVHRDLKPVNFLVKNGTYKLCDFGSAVFGYVDLRTPSARSEAEDVIQKTTTQMFRAPEMIDLFMTKKLTQSTDVWALGCCLYSLAFFQNCFEEGSNLAILSKNYKLPENNPYGEGLAELIDRMLTVNYKERADMTEVILCLSAIYSNKPLPPRKRFEKKAKGEVRKGDVETKERIGTYRTDGQGIGESVVEVKKPVKAKKLNPNSAAARRRNAAKQTASEVSTGFAADKNDSSTPTHRGFANFGSSKDSFNSIATESRESSEKKGSASKDFFQTKENENENLGFGNMDSENDIQSFSQEKNVNFATFEKESGWDMNDDHSLGNKSFNGFFDSNPTFALEEPTSGLNITPTRRRLEFDPKLDHSPALEDSNFSEFNREGLSSVESPKDRRRSKTITDTIRALGKESPERKRGLKGLKNLFRKNEQRQ